jgi:pimeloyl-ACP methyl ester carboxylesterase
MRLTISILALAGVILGQTAPETAGPFITSTRTVNIPGIAGGNASVSLLVTYPATSSAANAPFGASAAPCPLIVFGHGFSLSADLYATLFAHWASHGWIVAAPTTEQGLFTGNLPKFIADCEAAVIGLRAAVQSPASPFFGAMSASVLAIAAGHSFGGSAAIVAASARPDLFLAVTTMAATSTSPQGVDILGAVANLSVPALHFGASSDTVVPTSQNLDPIYAATPTTRIKVKIAGGTHSYFHEAWYADRLTESPGQISVAQQQMLVRLYSTAFFAWKARADLQWLERLLGPSAHTDSALSGYESVLLDPVLFAAGQPVTGQVYSLFPTWQPGDGVIVGISPGGANVPTPYGALLLDLSTSTTFDAGQTGPAGFATVSAIVPGGPPYSGAIIHAQALIFRPGAARLTNPVVITLP